MSDGVHRCDKVHSCVSTTTAEHCEYTRAGEGQQGPIQCFGGAKAAAVFALFTVMSRVKWGPPAASTDTLWR